MFLRVINGLQYFFIIIFLYSACVDHNLEIEQEIDEIKIQETQDSISLIGHGYNAFVHEGNFIDTVDASVDSIRIDMRGHNASFEVIQNDTILDDSIIILEDGTNFFSIIIDNGSEFEISIFRKKTPSSLINVIEFSPSLDKWTGLKPGVFVYDLVVPREIYNISINPTVDEAVNVLLLKDDLEVNNPLKLLVGANKFIIRSFAKDSSQFTEYTFNIFRQPLRIADLFNLNLSEGTLAPRFNKDVYHYTLSLPPEFETLSVSPALDSLASVSYLLDGQLVSPPFSIPDTESLLRITVIADDATTYKTYNIRIFRNEWKYRGRGPFAARDGASILEFNNKIWLLGGWSFEGSFNDVWSSDDGVIWNFMGNAPWSARHGAGAVVFDNRMWILSGDGHTDVWSSIDGVHWVKELDNAPWGKRYAPYVVAYRDKIWLMGGDSFYADSGYGYNDVWSSDDGITWTQVNDNAPWMPRGLIHGNVVFDDKIWLIGGGLKGPLEDVSYADVWNTTDGVVWNKISDSVPWEGRFHFSVAVHDSRIWITDGSVGNSENLTNEVWSSSDGIEWVQMTQIPWAPRHASSLKSFNGSLFLICGYLRNEIWELPP